MELKHYRLVKTIAEQGNIANSSEKLFLTQSALSHQLREVEGSLGIKVFIRKPHRWVLTEEGEALYAVANQILDTIAQGFAEIDALRVGTAGTVRLGTSCYAFYQGLPHFIQKMGLLYPQVSVSLALSATHDPIGQLLGQAIDMALVSGKPSNPALAAAHVRDDEVMALLHREHHLAQKAHLAPDDFATAHLLIHSFPLDTVAVYQHCLKSRGIAPGQATAIPMTEVALEMAAANMGIMCVPPWAMAAMALPSTLVYKPIGPQGLRRAHYLAWRHADTDKKYMKDFVANFLETFGEA